MAKIICTGKHEAVSLKALHGHQILQFDQVAADAEACGGDSMLLGAFRGGVLQFFRLLATRQFYPMRPKKRRPTE